MKRKLQPFFNGNLAIYVLESHVKQIMKLATDGSFSEMKTTFVTDDKNWFVVFEYKTNFGKGTIKLQSQKVEVIGK